MASISRDAIYQDLVAAARRRFGDERAAALGPDLEALAAHLALVAETPIPDDVEPDFLAPAE
jgi:hypothetical protein